MSRDEGTAGHVAPGRTRRERLGRLGAIATGVTAGIAWTGALRAVMAEVAAADSEVHWATTFGLILLPGAVAGGLLACGFLRRGAADDDGDGPRARGAGGFVLAPLLLGLDPTALPVPLAFLGLGYACSSRGRRAGRIVAGVLSAALLAVVPFVPSMLNPGLTVTMPRGAWLALLTASLIALGAAVEIHLQAPDRRVARLAVARRLAPR